MNISSLDVSPPLTFVNNVRIGSLKQHKWYLKLCMIYIFGDRNI